MRGAIGRAGGPRSVAAGRRAGATKDTTMIVQIYTAQSIDEARAMADLGVDHIGLTPAHHDLPGEIDYETAAAIGAALNETKATVVALTVDRDLDAISEMAAAVRPEILHFCPPSGAIEPELIAEFRRRFPEMAVMYAVSVAGPEALDEARRFEAVSDWFILDTQAPGIPGVGASGAVHDWSVSRRIVQEAEIPVILAGGLSPDNVSEAVRTVRPAGVDSLTHTNRDLGGGRFEKDLELVGAFASAARSEAERLGL